MVDTIILRLNNLHKYPFLEGRLNQKKAYGFSSETAYVPNPAYMPIEILKATKFDGSQDIQKKYNYVTYKPSHSSKITAFINMTENYVRFNLSLPKLLYGHNVKHLFRMRPTGNTPLECVTEGWEGLWYGLDALFRELGMDGVPCDDLELERIDTCMNWLADDSGDKQMKLTSMMSNRKAYQRVDAPQFAQYQTTLFFKTDKGSYKIYDKGKEFRKNDYSSIVKYNKTTADELGWLADRTLRFEVSFRSSLISYHFHRMNTPKIILQVTDQKDLNEAASILYDNLGEILPNGNTIYSAMASTLLPMDEFNIMRTCKQVAKGLRRLVQRKPRFLFSGVTNNNPFGICEGQACFSFEVFELLITKFQDFVNDMSLNYQELPEETPEDVKKYHLYSLRFQDYELLAMNIYAKQTIKNLRSLRKKWLKKSVNKIVFGMSDFNEQFIYL